MFILLKGKRGWVAGAEGGQFSLFSLHYEIDSNEARSHAVMSKYRCRYRFKFLLHLLAIFSLQQRFIYTYSLLKSMQHSTLLANNICGIYKKATPGARVNKNSEFSLMLVHCLSFWIIALWLYNLLLCSGDIHPNPGPLPMTPSSNLSNSSSDMSNTAFNSLSLVHNLSIVHYNVQSIFSKLEILHAELFEFDILAFTETWLGPTIDTDDLILQSYYRPERKDRDSDTHGGVMLYVKEGLHYKRRDDLELLNIENIWIELANSHKRLLLGLFYRPPNSDAAYLAHIEDSISLAIDTGIPELIITGDFNLNLLNQQTFRKIHSICTHFSLYQCIDEPTHYTEHSSSVIDLLFVSNKDHLIHSGVADAFLNQDLRYHCPIYGIFKFSKPKVSSFTRRIWYFDRCDFNVLRNKVNAVDWNSLQDNNIDTYANNIHSTVMSLATECIPNKHVRVRPVEPAWINSKIKRYIRKRKRAYKRAKRTNVANDWIKFKTLRNKTISEIRSSKKSFMTPLRPNSLHQHFLPKTGGLRLKVLLVQTQPHQSLPFHLTELYTQTKLTKQIF